ncbi:MAG TPA: hypothetical protein VJ437_06785 [Acidiferrobacterales bacterium]|nr:hypothetical protein [Acidiferrobacterales bacterium]
MKAPIPCLGRGMDACNTWRQDAQGGKQHQPFVNIASTSKPGKASKDNQCGDDRELRYF